MSTLHEGRKYLSPSVKEELQRIVNILLPNGEESRMVRIDKSLLTTIVECAAVSALSTSDKLDIEGYKPGKWMQD